MSKSKAFKRKVKSPRFGFQYYRIWGWPLPPHAVSFHQEHHGLNPNVAIFKHPTFGWLRLSVERCTFGCSRERVSASTFNRYRLRPCPLNGAISDRYYRKHTQALRVLREYADGIRHDGLAEMVHYHEQVAAFDCRGAYE